MVAEHDSLGADPGTTFVPKRGDESTEVVLQKPKPAAWRPRTRKRAAQGSGWKWLVRAAIVLVIVLAGLAPRGVILAGAKTGTQLVFRHSQY
jgi:hypothetical protein